MSFTVTALGPALSYQWFFNGTNALAGATNSMLSLANLGPSQSGNYSVLASNFSRRGLQPAGYAHGGPDPGHRYAHQVVRRGGQLLAH